MRRLLLLLLGSLSTAGLALGWQPPVVVAPEPPPGSARTFDPRDARVLWARGHWQLVAGADVLKDFGPREPDARQALRLLQELGVNQHVVVGSPNVVLEYWLADGKAPQGSVRTGLREVALDPAALKIEQVSGQWMLRDASRTLMQLGPNAGDAQQALDVIRRYQFDKVAVLGQVQPTMYVFTAQGRGHQATLPTLPTTGTSSRHLNPPRFSRLAKNADGSPRMEKGKASGLEALAAPVIPPLSDPLRKTLTQQNREFHWRADGQSGPLTTVQPGDRERVTFDWRQVKLKQDKADWKIVAGSLELGNFGPAIHEARQALMAIRHYRFTEQCRLGGANAYMTYYVAAGNSPSGVLLGVPAEEVKVEALDVRKLAAGYAVCQGARVVFQLRDHEADAKRLVDTMKQHNCDRVCRIGGGGAEPLTILVRSHNDPDLRRRPEKP